MYIYIQVHMYGQMYGPFFRSCEPKPMSLLENDLKNLQAAR